MVPVYYMSVAHGHTNSEGPCDGNVLRDATGLSRSPGSCCGGVLPLLSGVCPEEAQGAAGEEMALE